MSATLKRSLYLNATISLWERDGMKSSVALAKQRAIDAGLPERVVAIYMEAPEQRITNRMKNVLRKALVSSTPSTSSTTHLDALSEVKEQQMRYAFKATPAQRQMQSKLSTEFVLSSSDSDLDEPSSKKRKTDREGERPKDAEREAEGELREKLREKL